MGLNGAAVSNQETGITAIGSVINVSPGAKISAWPTAGGSPSAALYYTGSPPAAAWADIVAGGATIAANNGHAQWDEWAPGTVTAKTVERAPHWATYAVLVVSSGTWTLEICQ